MRQRLIAGLAALAIGIVGAVAFASPSNASTFTGCTGPEAKVTETQAKSIVKDIDPAACLDLQFTDKCDGTTVVTMTNWAFNDNKFTVLTVKLDGKEYTLKGGSDPNTETVTLGPPGVEDLQATLIFRFTAPDGSKITIEKPYGDPWTWEEPKGCVSPSPSASATPTATATPSPSVSVSTSAPATTSEAPAPAGSNDLPITGSPNALLLIGAVLLFLLGGVAWFLNRRRNAEPVA